MVECEGPAGLASDEDFLWKVRDDVLKQIAEPLETTVLRIKTWKSISRTRTELRLWKYHGRWWRFEGFKKAWSTVKLPESGPFANPPHDWT